MSEIKGFEHWLVGLPGDKDGWQKVVGITKKFAECYKFPVPELRVGTLDHLLTASVDLERLHSELETVISKVLQTMVDVWETKKEDLDQFQACQVEGKPVKHYLMHFKWDIVKYHTGQTIKSLNETLYMDMDQLEHDMRNQHTQYITLKNELGLMEKNQRGPLLTRDISHLVKKEHFVMDSEHLITALVVVPKVSYAEWHSSYERLDDEVVPRSTNLLYEEGAYGLFNVTLFKRHFQQFSSRAKELGCSVRDYVYDEEKIEMDRAHLMEVKGAKMAMFGPLVRLLKVAFSDAYIALIHVQLMRVFIEAVLRFGLPTNYLCLCIIVPKKNVKKMREIMFKEYSYIDDFPKPEDKTESEVVATQPADYFPYVSFKVNAEAVDFK